MSLGPDRPAAPRAPTSRRVIRTMLARPPTRRSDRPPLGCSPRGAGAAGAGTGSRRSSAAGPGRAAGPHQVPPTRGCSSSHSPCASNRTISTRSTAPMPPSSASADVDAVVELLGRQVDERRGDAHQPALVHEAVAQLRSMSLLASTGRRVATTVPSGPRSPPLTASIGDLDPVAVGHPDAGRHRSRRCPGGPATAPAGEAAHPGRRGARSPRSAVPRPWSDRGRSAGTQPGWRSGSGRRRRCR